jgi:hypothetical protein
MFTPARRANSPIRITRLYASREALDARVYFGMDYSVGSRVKVRLHNGEVVEAEITAIIDVPSGRQVHIAFARATAAIDPAQIIKVLR